MEKNKTGKYLKYAIGEIILVVIGILIALSINNWNEKRNNLKKGQTILIQLKKEYKSNLLQLDEKILMRSKIVRSCKDILDIIDNPISLNQDSLFQKIATLTLDPTFDPVTNDLISSGNLRLIKNEDLKQKLSNWTSDILALQEMELQWQKMTLQINFPFIVRLNIYRDIANVQYKNETVPVFILDKSLNGKLNIGKSKKTPSLAEVLNNPELESLVTKAITDNYLNNLQSHSLRNKINDIINLIDKEIKR
ncbi:hypothetical protein ES692_04745 [Psychroserpens burtonensis]|uniref:Uncharacterized protein n=1 Tax=Psychroserpens burtonensis TaxID=49278 RepID=A0A5C7B9H3_9FLAO|nr:DUF6090 family protein [Psychroserpens burtonensis]TXE19164.1 hypothetical protein ES692_04745 [Psychroserpens burtonensis]